MVSVNTSEGVLQLFQSVFVLQKFLLGFGRVASRTREELTFEILVFGKERALNLLDGVAVS